jgi:hypothetical protein
MINGFGIPTQPEVLVMMFGQRSSKLQERLGGGRLGPDGVFCLTSVMRWPCIASMQN